MKKLKYITLLLLLLCGTQNLFAIRCGADQIDKILPLARGRRVGLIINHTSVVGPSQVSLLDTLITCGIDVVKVFAPEHGFRGDADAGESVVDGCDAKTGVPITSLYGSNKRPTQAQLSDVDLLIFDIQDVGARFYTYISTMYYAMQACAQYDVPMVVLDRPNPCDYVDGPIISEDLFSFVGALPLPILHGLTVGELAMMINGEGWCEAGEVDLQVVPVVGWRHGAPYDLPIKPSPNLPTAQAVALYPSLCLFEATKVSVGRGTLHPFQMLGYPDPKFGDFTFTPQSLAGFDKNPLQRGKVCYGVDLRDVQAPEGLSLGYFIEWLKRSGRGADFVSSKQLFNMLSGDRSLLGMIVEGQSEQQIKASWQPALVRYRKMRSEYLLYPDYVRP